MSEPVFTQPNEHGTGRPVYTDDQYQVWLNEMKPHLELGCTLNRAIEKAGLMTHEFSIREKYRLNDWFSRKIDVYRQLLGENINEAFARMTFKILDKVKREEALSRDDIDILKHMSEKHRSSQPFFVTRREIAQINKDDSVYNILQKLDDDYGEWADEYRPEDNQGKKLVTDYRKLAEQASEERAKTQTEPLPVSLNPSQV